jgi:hypothetical protein
MGRDYAALVVARRDGRLVLERRDAVKADAGGAEGEVASRPLRAAAVELRVDVAEGALCRFSARAEGEAGFAELGPPFTAREGLWIGAKVGLFARSSHDGAAGRARFDAFEVSGSERRGAVVRAP